METCLYFDRLPTGRQEQTNYIHSYASKKFHKENMRKMQNGSAGRPGQGYLR